MLQLTERHSTSKARLLRLLADLQDSGRTRFTLHLKPESLELGRVKQVALDGTLDDNAVNTVLRDVGPSDTGLSLFWGEEQTVAVIPPFPLREDSYSDGADTSPLVELLEREFIIGVVLLRLGRYSVGVLRGERLVASKTGSRYVKNRHRAGGSSQRRFERSRERLVRELFDKACEVVRDVFSRYESNIDYVLLGGERHTLRGLTERCHYLRDFGPGILGRTLPVDRPGKDALDNIAFEVWKSRVMTFQTLRE